MPSITDITNQVLNKLGRPAVADITNDNDALVISQQIPLFLGDLILRYTWNFAIKFYSSSTPLTTNISDSPILPPEYLYNYQLPSDYGRFFRWEFPLTAQFGLFYEILDGVMMTSINPVSFYYIVNTIDLSYIPVPFEQALIYYTAYQVCLSLTNNAILEASLEKKYDAFLANAIMQNDMELYKAQVPYNDFNRQSFI